MAYVKGIARAFNLPKCLGGFMNLKPTLGYQMSTSILGGGSINIPCKIPDGKFLAHMGFKSMVLPGTLTDLSACVGFRTST